MKLVEGKAVDVIKVLEVGRYVLQIDFDDGHRSVIDFEPFLRASLNPQTQQFLDGDRFGSYALRDGNVVWGDYDMCFSIEQLYTGSLGVGVTTPGRRQLAVAEERAPYGVKGRGRK
jgi:hypothetical protein